MQPNVVEVGCFLEQQRKPSRRIGGDQRNLLLTQQLNQSGITVGIVADFQAVPKRSILIRARPVAAVESVVMTTREIGGLAGGARQSRQKRIERRRLERHRGRQLPEHWTKLRSERQQARGKEVRETGLNIS